MHHVREAGIDHQRLALSTQLRNLQVAHIVTGRELTSERGKATAKKTPAADYHVREAGVDHQRLALSTQLRNLQGVEVVTVSEVTEGKQQQRRRQQRCATCVKRGSTSVLRSARSFAT
jgi:hypothetical protein